MILLVVAVTAGAALTVWIRSNREADFRDGSDYVVPPVDRESLPTLKRAVIAECADELDEQIGSTNTYPILDTDGAYHFSLYSDEGDGVGTATASTASGRIECEP